MMQVTSDQWLSWLSLYFWPLLRVLALISTAPILSERSVPKRVKLGLAMMITFAIAPSLPANDVPVFSFFALWLAVQQILIGIALGFTMQFAFAAVRTAGEIIGLQMGLSFRSGCQLDYRDLSTTIVRQTPNHTWPGRWAKRCALTGGNGLRGDCERAKP